MDAYQTAILNLTDAKGHKAGVDEAKAVLDQAVAALSLLQQKAQANLTAAQALVGTATVGIKSVLTQRAEAERLVGITALIDAIQANHSLTVPQAQAAWKAAVSAAYATPPLEDPVGVVTAIMAIAGCADWNAFLALVANGQRADLIAAVS